MTLPSNRLTAIAKAALRRCARALLVLLITFALTETTFRIYNHFRPSFIFYTPSYNRFRGKPTSPEYDFHLNSRGFKDVEFKVEKDPGTYRILGLGDSFAFGVVPYRHNYLTLLEEYLNRGGRKTEVINMGIPRTGPRDYLALLVDEGLQLKPDMVLVSFFVGNDFAESVEIEKRSLYSYSHVASFMAYLIATSRGYEGRIYYPSPVYEDNVPTATEPVFDEIEVERSYIFQKRSDAFPIELEAAMGALTRIKQICDERHIALAIVLIPDEVQINPTLQAHIVQLKKSSADDFDFAIPNRSLAARLQSQHIDFLDLLPEFTRVGSQTILYKPRDTHWNIAGNRLAATTIAQDLFHVPLDQN